jgi:histidinol-phosphate aminotransferase
LSQLTTLRPTIDPVSLVRPVVRELAPYKRDPEPDQTPPRDIRLDMNESPYGASPKARAAIAGFDLAHRYPEFDAFALRAALARYADVAPDRVVVGAGLDDVLATLSLLMLDSGDRVIISEPTFGVYRPLFTQHGGEVLDVPLLPDFTLDVDGILDAIDERTKIVLICNPNNPTGNAFDPSVVERICAEAGCLVAIDEAYAEFAGTTAIPLAERYPHVVVLRTMSKFAGLAGMRVGYGVFPLDLVPYAMRVMPAFGNVSAVSAAAALASLDDLDYLRHVIATIVADRDRLAVDLGDIRGVVPLPSATNFLLVRLPVSDARPVIDELKHRGIFVRRVALPEYLRVTVGTPEENRIFVTELRAILAGKQGTGQ